MRTDPLIERLPEALAERVRLVASGDGAGGRHVVYWMHHAVRGHENPALDAAITAAAVLDRPLLVYQGLGGNHRFNNDRHHTFILEGAREARAELAARGLTHAFWLGDDPSAASPLHTLAETAALVVTEDFPAPPFPRWTEALGRRMAAPLWVVDTACVVPMRLVGGEHDRAFRFRRAIQRLLSERLSRPWRECELTPRPFDRELLPFADLDLAGADIGALVARCPIDHTVGPVAHTVGGSAAGEERWRQFRDRRLKSYAARRNDAAGDGVSRLSPYLHHGQVSPLRIARETAALQGKGPEKFLDELVIWRELAHNLCFHRWREVESLAVLPGWARETLARHAGDRRDALSWETLARGRSGDRLWDLCQASLVRHGELHNNVRMTWGKAIPGWTRSPEEALATLLDLNHRFALDGSDPNSYGGLLWCLGLFDRPFEPEREILGSVRPRPTSAHARRLDLDRYGERVLPPAASRPLEVAIVGAGLSGLVCGRTLADHGHRVRVFDKARGVGGRMSIRRRGDWHFDHGAQYFTVKDERFGRLVDSWRRDGVVERWDGRITVLGDGGSRSGSGSRERYVGVPGMNGICRHLAADLDVTGNTRVARIERDSGRWRLWAEDGADLGRFDAVAVSAPGPQAAALLSPVAPRLAQRAGEARIAPCYAVMAAFPQPLGLDFDGAFVHQSPLSWVARNGSKPGRPEGEAWVLHGSPAWSEQNVDLDETAAADRLLEAFRLAVGGLAAEPIVVDAHRWLYALPVEPLSEACVFDAGLALGACGDWCGGPRVEGAFLSGAALAGRFLTLALGDAQATLF